MGIKGQQTGIRTREIDGVFKLVLALMCRQRGNERKEDG